jgi:hypothetical protein
MVEHERFSFFTGNKAHQKVEGVRYNVKNNKEIHRGCCGH